MGVPTIDLKEMRKRVRLLGVGTETKHEEGEKEEELSYTNIMPVGSGVYDTVMILGKLEGTEVKKYLEDHDIFYDDKTNENIITISRNRDHLVYARRYCSQFWQVYYNQVD